MNILTSSFAQLRCVRAPGPLLIETLPQQVLNPKLLMDEVVSQITPPLGAPRPHWGEQLAQNVTAPERMMEKTVAHDVRTSRETTFNDKFRSK